MRQSLRGIFGIYKKDEYSRRRERVVRMHCKGRGEVWAENNRGRRYEGGLGGDGLAEVVEARKNAKGGAQGDESMLDRHRRVVVGGHRMPIIRINVHLLRQRARCLIARENQQHKNS